MIDNHWEEQAALYVLGALSEAESRDFTARLQSDAELQAYVARLSTPLGALAGNIPHRTPPPHVRENILARLPSPTNIVPLPERSPSIGLWLLGAAAACLAILCAFLYARDNQLHDTVGQQAQTIDDLQQIARSLESKTNTLAHELQSLREENRLAGLRIGMLKSLLPSAPKATAVSLWDGARQTGVFVGENLMPLPEDRDFELWIIDENKKPVAAGVFHVDRGGAIRIDFKTSEFVKAVAEFAVTEEIKGGVPTPTLKNMVLAGK
jgi:anti-sigma-K factor RskA